MQQCSVCGGKTGRLAIESGDYRYLRCTGCSIVRIDPFPEVDEAHALFGDAYFTEAPPGGYADYQADADVHRRNARARMRKVGSPNRPGNPLVDVGCAYGYTMDAARDDGWAPVGVDVNESARQAVREHGMPCVPSLADVDLPLGSAHAVTFFQSLEHMPDPVTELTAARQLLGDDGRVVIETWNATSLVARLLRQRWQQVSPPAVLWLFGKADITLMCGLAGLQVDSYRPSAKWVSTQQVFGHLGRRAGSSPGAVRRRFDRLSLPYGFGDLVTITASVRT